MEVVAADFDTMFLQEWLNYEVHFFRTDVGLGRAEFAHLLDDQTMLKVLLTRSLFCLVEYTT